LSFYAYVYKSTEGQDSADCCAVASDKRKLIRRRPSALQKQRQKWAIRNETGSDGCTTARTDRQKKTGEHKKEAHKQNERMK